MTETLLANASPAVVDLVQIGSLWIDGSLSWMEIASLQSFVALGHDVVLYSYGTVPNVPAGVDLRDAREIWDTNQIVVHKETGSPAPHADIFRVMMARQTGRVWVDTDVIALRPFTRDIRWFLGHERQDKQELGNAVFGLPTNSRLLISLHDFLTDPAPIPPWMPERQRGKLAAFRKENPHFGFGDMAWGISGPKALTHFAVSTGEIEHAHPQDVFFPVSFQERKLLTEPRHADALSERIAAADSRSVHLYSRWLRKVSQRSGGLPPRDSWIGRWASEHGILEYPPAAALVPTPALLTTGNSDMVEDGSKAVQHEKAEAQAIERACSAAAQTAMDGLPARKALIPGGANVSRHGRVSIVTMAKDEGPYVLEWVAHHHVLGFTDILAYTNDCTDGTDEMFDALASVGLVTRLANPPWRGKPPQSRALHWAENNPLIRESDWLLVMDLDEFVAIKTGDYRVDDLIDAIVERNGTGMCLAWRFFGSADQDRFDFGPVTERLTRAATDGFTKGYGVKTLFRADPHLTLAIHRPYLKARFTRTEEGKDYRVDWLNGSGAPLNGRGLRWRLNSHQIGYELAQMNYYGVKSREEYLLRRLRGDVLDNHSKYDGEYFGIFDRNEIEDRSAMALHVERDALMAELLNIPVVRKAAALVEKLRLERLDKLRRPKDFLGSMRSLLPYPLEKAMKVKRR